MDLTHERSPARRTRVLIVDDSALIRQLLTQVLSQDQTLEVVGTAGDPYVAWKKIQELRPDVITLDVEMPRMDGLTFLEKLMRANPLPVVMVSSLTERGCETTLRALELGAVDFVTKPKVDIRGGTVELGEEIVAKVKAASRTRPRQLRSALPPACVPVPRAPAPRTEGFLKTTHGVIALGASTGGTEALRVVLEQLPPDSPGVVVVQHMPEKFTSAFAQRLDGLCQMRVSEARDGDRVLPGHVLIAPGNFQMRLARSGASYGVRITAEPPVSHHRPSVDVLFESCARDLGANAAAAILTGMGDDGARGLLAMRSAGATTLAQDEATCVVFGMPREAIAIGAAQEVLPLDAIAPALMRWARARR